MVFVVDFAKKHWRSLVVVVLVVGAFFGGRALAPTKVQVVEKVVKVQDNSKAQVDSQQDIKTEVVYVDRPVDRVITRTIVKEPDGKVTDTTTDATHRGDTTVTSNQTQQTKVEVKVEKQVVYQEKTVEKVVDHTLDSRWEVGLQAGYNFPKLGINYVPGVPKDLVLGVSGGYKLTKSLKVGVWVNSQGSAGGQISLSF